MNGFDMRRAGAALIALAAAASLAACTGEDGDATGGGAVVDEREYNDLALAMADANRLHFELQSVTDRLLRRCMEDRGYTVHPELPFANHVDPGTYARYPVVGGEPPYVHLTPSAEDAAVRGLGVHEEWEAIVVDGDDGEGLDPQFAAQGWDYMSDYHAVRNGSDDFAFAEGGCFWEVAERLHGDAYDLSDPDNGEALAEFAPPMPGELGMELYFVEFGDPELDAALEAFGDCLADRGHPRITVIDWYVIAFVYTFYPPPADLNWGPYGDAGEYPRPEGSPWSFEEAREREIAFAVDVAECADATSLREERQRAWDLATVDLARDHEQDLYAWRAAMEETLERAQELLVR